MFSNPTAVTFIGYLIVMVGVGVFAYYYTRSYTDFILGGRSLGGFVTALSVGASDMSGWLLMGLPGAVSSLAFLKAGSLSGLFWVHGSTGALPPPDCASIPKSA